MKTGSNYEYQYYMKDHFGSVRVMFRGINREVLERNHYYPSGARIKSAILWLKNYFIYIGKELQDYYSRIGT